MSSWTRVRVAAALSVAGALTGAVVLALAVIPKSSPVELTLRLRRVAFVVPGPRPPHDHVPLFGAVPKVVSLQARGARRLRYHGFPAGDPQRRELEPGDRFVLRADRPWRPFLRLKRELRVELEPARRHRLRVQLSARRGEGIPWQLDASSVGALDLRIDTAQGQSVRTAAPAPPPAAVGGTETARLGLEFQGPVGRMPPRAHVFNLDDPGEAVTLELPAPVPEGAGIRVAGGRLVLLQPSSLAPASGLLHDNLELRRLELYRLVGRQAESYLRGGRIRFLGEERSPAGLSPDFLLAARGVFTLKAAALADGELELVLWGEPETLRYGPTPGLMGEMLPSLLLWLYTHESGALAFSAMAWVMATLLGVLRFLGVTPERGG